MKSYLLLFILLTTACSRPLSDTKGIRIDLHQEQKSIPYSAFVRSIAYLPLNTNDSCLLSGIRRIYADLPYLFIEDEKKGGIFIFTTSGRFVKQINTYGEGPEEFSDITAFAIDLALRQLCIHDGYSGKLMKYTYEGEFIRSYKNDVLVRDFAVFPQEKNLFILPSYREGLPSGLWLQGAGDSTVTKILLNDVPKADQFEFVYTFYNLTRKGIYYYDRNWDRLSFITPDSASRLYSFDVKQRVPEHLRMYADPGLQALSPYAMMANFSCSKKYIAFTFYGFDPSSVPFKWVLFNQATGEVNVSSHLINDMDSVRSTQPYLYHLNDSLWCRLLDSEENDCTLTLQLLSIQ